jgi:hypothetical protein
VKDLINDIDGIDGTGAFREHEKKAQQILFKEKQVDNLMNMIYSPEGGEQTVADSDEALDTNRYDVAEAKLAMYRRKAVKRKLKQRFVTGQSQD